MDVKTASRTLKFFEVFAADPRPMRLIDLALALEMPVSSCFHLLGTLERRGYAYLLGQKTYYPTKAMLSNAQAIAANDPVLMKVGPVLARLRDSTSESVIFGVLSEKRATILEVVESPNNVRYTANAGETRDLHSSSLGKALLGAMSQSERDLVLPADPYPPMTPFTITTRDRLDDDLAQGAARGWYQSLSERDLELHAVSAPVRMGGRLFAISVAGPITRFAPLREAHAKAMQDAIREIESRD